MTRLSAALLTLIGLTPSNAMALEPEAWEGVYKRSGTTVKAGEYMGIGGAVLSITGFVITLNSGVALISSGAEGGEGSAEKAEKAAGGIVMGAAMGFTGLVAFSVGPAVVAGGSVRQNKAVRMLNPDAPGPWLGYTSWGLWTAGIGTTFAGQPLIALLLHSGAYTTGAIQRGKNRVHFEGRSTASFDTQRSRFQVALVPVTIEGNRGLGMIGTF